MPAGRAIESICACRPWYVASSVLRGNATMTATGPPRFWNATQSRCALAGRHILLDRDRYIGPRCRPRVHVHAVGCLQTSTETPRSLDAQRLGGPDAGGRMGGARCQRVGDDDRD